MSLFRVDIPIAIGIAALAAIAFIVFRVRQREREFSLLDSMLLMILMVIATAGGITLVEAASLNAKDATLRENLRTFRTQIEAYKLQHRGNSPVLFQGTFPQLTQATNSEGIPGPSDQSHPFGPYFRTGIPVNPITGRCVVTETDTSPPERASGGGGWLYHPKSGAVAIDLAEYLAE